MHASIDEAFVKVNNRWVAPEAVAKFKLHRFCLKMATTEHFCFCLAHILMLPTTTFFFFVYDEECQNDNGAFFALCSRTLNNAMKDSPDSFQASNPPRWEPRASTPRSVMSFVSSKAAFG